jgi:hypothetical protein
MNGRLRFKHFYINLFLTGNSQLPGKWSAYTASLNSLLQQRRQQNPAPTSAASAPAFPKALFDLLLHPRNILLLWNWKAAVLSLGLRGPIFLAASVRRGWKVAIAALLTESAFCVLSAGFYGAVAQSLRDAQPLWVTGIFLTVVVPAIFQVLEYWLHRLRGTPHLRPAEMVSLTVSALSALFNWYAMRRGTLLVGAEGDSLGADVRRLPALIFSFLALPPGKIAQRVREGQPGRRRTAPHDVKRR